MDRKTMGLWSCVALVVGNMIGSGIFMNPYVVAQYVDQGIPLESAASLNSWYSSPCPTATPEP